MPILFFRCNLCQLYMWYACKLRTNVERGMMINASILNKTETFAGYISSQVHVLNLLLHIEHTYTKPYISDRIRIAVNAGRTFIYNCSYSIQCSGL